MPLSRRLPHQLVPVLGLALIAVTAAATAQQSPPQELCSTNCECVGLLLAFRYLHGKALSRRKAASSLIELKQTSTENPA